MLHGIDINEWIEQNAYKTEHSLSSSIGALSSYQATHTWNTTNSPNLHGPQQQLLSMMGQPWGGMGMPSPGLTWGGVYPNGVYPSALIPFATEEHKEQSKTEFKEPLEDFYQESIDTIFKLQDILAKMQDELHLHEVMRTTPKFDLFIRIEAIKALIEDKRTQLLLHYNSQLIAAKEFYEGKK